MARVRRRRHDEDRIALGRMNRQIVAVIFGGQYRILFHDPLSAPASPCFTTASGMLYPNKLTAAKRDVTTVVSDERSRFTASSIDYYTHGHTNTQRKLSVIEYAHEQTK